MHQLPIHKIFVAGFAFATVHWKKILEISIIPVLISLPLLMSAPELIALAKQMFANKLSEPPIFLDNTGLYLALFFYGHLSLSINLYRLVVLGEQSVSILPVLEFVKIARFIGLTLLVGFVSMATLIMNNLLWLSLLISFLVVPITLNFVNIAIGNPIKYRWELSFPAQLNLFFLQVVVPMLIVLLFGSLSRMLALDIGVEWAARVLAFYWSLITLALCYQLITKESQSNT